MVQQRSVGGSALLWGSIFGGLVVILDLIDHFLLGGVDRVAPAIVAVLRRRHLVVVRTVNPGRILLVEGIVLLITFSLFFLAGVLAARRAGASEAGIGAGALAGAIVGVAHMTIVVVIIFLAAHPAVGAEIVRGLLVAFSALILGVALGALGGLIGRGPRERGAPSARPLYTPPPAPATIDYYPSSSSAGPVTPSVQAPGERTPPTPYHYGPQNDYPTAPLQTPSQF
jgi:hypothetical protein